MTNTPRSRIYDRLLDLKKNTDARMYGLGNVKSFVEWLKNKIEIYWIEYQEYLLITDTNYSKERDRVRIVTITMVGNLMIIPAELWRDKRLKARFEKQFDR